MAICHYFFNAKQAIDAWYRKNILGKSFEVKLDTKEIYCGDRSTSNNFGSCNLNVTAMRIKNSKYKRE